MNLGFTVSTQWDLLHCMGYVGLSHEVLRRTWIEAAMAHGILLGTLSSTMLPWGNLTLWYMSTCVRPFSSRLTTSNFSPKLSVFHRFSNWIALGDECLCFTLVLITKVNAVERGTASAEWLYHQSIHVTDGLQWCHLLLVSNTRHMCQITLNRRLLCTVYVISCKFEK